MQPFEVKDLWHVVNKVKRNLQLDTTMYDLQFYDYAIDGFRELTQAGLNKPLTFKTIRLELTIGADGKGRAPLPLDYVRYLKIGAFCNGKLINFDLNEDISTYKNQCPCTTDEINTCCGQGEYYDGLGLFGGAFWQWQWYYGGYFHNGQSVGGVYGAGAGFSHGGFNIDTEHNEIVFERCTDHFKEILMEYDSDGGLNTGVNVIVDTQIELTLRKYVHMERVNYMMEKDASLRGYVHRTRTKDFEDAVHRLLGRVNSYTHSEFLQMYRGTVRQTVKR